MCASEGVGLKVAGVVQDAWMVEFDGAECILKRLWSLFWDLYLFFGLPNGDFSSCSIVVLHVLKHMYIGNYKKFNVLLHVHLTDAHESDKPLKTCDNLGAPTYRIISKCCVSRDSR